MQVGAVAYIVLFSVLVFRTPDSAVGLMILLFAAGTFGSSVTVTIRRTQAQQSAL